MGSAWFRPAGFRLAGALLLGVVVTPGLARGDAAAPVLVGPQSVSLGELEARFGALTREELRSFGPAPGEARLAFGERVLVPELLLLAEAERLRLPEEPGTRARLRQALFEALAAEERQRLPAPSDEEMAASYAEHRREFERPERVALWRILVATEAEARDILEKVRGAGGPERWRALAREKSLDTATRERGGDLGFVHPDGRTDVPELRVDPALYAAARGIADGELVAVPVAEGDRHAVVWRRGSLRAERVSLEAARPTLERLIQERKLTARLDGLVAELSRASVRERNDAPLARIDVAVFDD
jgi:peptidyl-prolyl cis-trans isomerase C